MKSSELRQKSKEALYALLEEKKGRLDELRFLLIQKKFKNVKEAAAVRKDIARLKTLLK